MPAPLSLPKGYQRLGSFPLDDTFVFGTKAELDTYASTNPTAYTGQICSVGDTGLVYVILADKSLSQVGSSGQVGAHNQDISTINGLQTALDSKALLTVYATTPPSPAAEGQRWVDTADYHAYERLNNAWIEIFTA
jgi:hypothetical protein